MSNKRITDLVEKTPTTDFWIEVVDPTDLTDSPDGSSFKSKLPIGSGTPQGLQSVLDTDGYAENTDGSNNVELDIDNGQYGFNNYDPTDDTGTGFSLLKSGFLRLYSKTFATSDPSPNIRIFQILNAKDQINRILSILNSFSGALIRKTFIDFLSTGLKISSRSDDTEIGVVYDTDNLTVDRTRAEQDKDGTYALVGDITAQNGLNTDDDSNVVELGGSLTKNTNIITNGVGLFITGGENQGMISTSNQPAYAGGFGSVEIGISDDFGFLKSGFKFFRDKMLFVSNYGKGIEYGADYSSSYSDRSLVDSGWVNGFAVASSVIDFKRNSIYGTFTTPRTTNITVDLTGAKLGKVQKMYHQSGTVPTFPAGFVKKGSIDYSIVGKNEIYFEFSEGTRVEYWIVNI